MNLRWALDRLRSGLSPLPAPARADAARAMAAGICEDDVATCRRIGEAGAGLIEAAAAREGVTVYCAGVARNDEGDLVTAGGRVLNVVGRGATIAEARERAFAAIDDIHFDGMHVRRDIAAAAAEVSW